MESSTVQTEEPARIAVLGYRLNGFFLQRPVINLISDSLTAAVSAQTPGMKSLTHTGMSRWCKGFTEGTLQHLHIKNHMCYLQQGFKRQTRFNLYFMLLLNSDSREITGHEGTENQTSVSQR